MLKKENRLQVVPSLLIWKFPPKKNLSGPVRGVGWRGSGYTTYGLKKLTRLTRHACPAELGVRGNGVEIMLKWWRNGEIGEIKVSVLDAVSYIATKQAVLVETKWHFVSLKPRHIVTHTKKLETIKTKVILRNVPDMFLMAWWPGKCDLDGFLSKAIIRVIFVFCKIFWAEYTTRHRAF